MVGSFTFSPEWYLSVGLEDSDVIEYPIVDDMDVKWLDVRKITGCFGTNPAFVDLSPDQSR